MPPWRRSPAIRTVAASGAALAAATIPVFLFGALSASIGDELGFGEAGAGAAVTAFFVAAALGAVPLGRVTERIGARAAVRTGVVASALVCLAVAGLARTWWHLAALLAVVGGSIGLTDTGTARALTDRVRERRRGLAFGIKEASVPLASMLAGAAVPLLALRVGWRPAFAVSALLAPVVWLAMPALPRAAAASATAGAGDTSPAGAVATVPGRLPVTQAIARTPPALVVVAVGVAFGSAAATAAAAFMVPAVSATGVRTGAAGTLLAAASLVAVTARLVAGSVADRRGTRALDGMALAMAIGAVGAIGLATGGPPAVTAGAAVVLLGAGWGWTGLAFLAGIRAAPGAPAAAAGVVLSGLAVGGAAGPLVFGLAAARGSYTLAWLAVAGGLAAGAVTTVTARRALPHA